LLAAIGQGKGLGYADFEYCIRLCIMGALDCQIDHRRRCINSDDFPPDTDALGRGNCELACAASDIDKMVSFRYSACIECGAQDGLLSPAADQVLEKIHHVGTAIDAQPRGGGPRLWRSCRR